MAPASDSVLVLFPGALGDCLCALPAVVAVRRTHTGRCALVAQPAFFDLVRVPDTTTISIDRREIADLFAGGTRVAPETAALFAGFSHVYSWTGFGDANCARRLAQVSGGDVGVYRFRGMCPGEHASDYYARCIGVEPAALDASIVAADPRWFDEFAARHRLSGGRFVLLHPGSGAGEKNWEGFRAVAEYWHARYSDAVVVLHGPVERERPGPAIDGAIVADGLSLTQVATLLRRCRLYLGNDSGISHLAGLVGARGVVVFGPTDPAVWAPRGEQVEIVHAPDGCTRCGTRRFCTHRLAVDTVLAALERAEASAQT